VKNWISRLGDPPSVSRADRHPSKGTKHTAITENMTALSQQYVMLISAQRSRTILVATIRQTKQQKTTTLLKNSKINTLKVLAHLFQGIKIKMKFKRNSWDTRIP